MTRRTVVAQLDSLLSPRGFSRHGFTWNRRGESIVEVIDVQLSKGGDAVTINAGALDPFVHVAFSGGEPTDFVEQPLCTVGVRIGDLLDGRDKWWQLNSDSTSAEICEAVVTKVLPFLGEVSTRDGMHQWLVKTGVVGKKYPPPIINLAVIKSLLGEKDEACLLLAELQKKTRGAWCDKVADVAVRLGCRSAG